MKPAKCIHCPLYGDKLIAPIGETTGAEVAFLLESPPFFAKGGLEGREGSVLKEVLTAAAQGDSSGDTAKVINQAVYLYSVACASREAASVKLVNSCKENVGAQALLNSGAKVVVAFGAKALSFFGIKNKHRDTRGGAITTNFLGKTIQVVVTFSLANLLGKPGLASLVAKDIQKATKLVRGVPLDTIDVPKLLSGYDVPNSLTQAIEVAEHYSSYSPEGKSANQHMMALDFETNTLYAQYDKARVIAISGAVEEGKAFAIYVDHKDSPYTFSEIVPWIWKILRSPHPKTWWNYKFDYGMAKYTLVRQTREAMELDPLLGAKIESVVGSPLDTIFKQPILNTRWDGMLAEHMLDENKQGHYSLKQVVLDHFPSLSGYEKNLHKQLGALNTNRSDAMLDKAMSLKGNTLNNLSPIGYQGDLLLEIDKLKSVVASLNLKKKVKGTPKGHKVIIEDTIGILRARVKHIKKVKAATVKLLRTISVIDEGLSYANPTHAASTFEEVDTDIMMPYAAIDADLTLRISRDQRRRAWAEDPKSKADLEGRDFMMSLMDKHYIPLAEVLSTMQVEGMRVDVPYLLTEYDRQSEAEVKLESKLVAQIASDLGRDPDSIVLNNPTALADLLIAGYGLPKVTTTDKGEASSDKVALGVWGATNAVAKEILVYRDVVKARSTYIANLLAFSDYDGYVHGSLLCNGTATGRLSSRDPALQTMPPVLAGTEMKRAFTTTNTSSSKSPQDINLMSRYGWKDDEELCVVDLDFAGAEVRGLTVYAQDPALLEALNKGLDMHSWVASIVFELNYEAINTARKVDKALQTPEEKKLVIKRQQAKAIVFGMIFCISAPKLATDLEIQVYEAEALMSMFFQRFPKIKEYIEGTKYKVSKEGVLRTPTGRARRFPLAAVGGGIGAACGRQGVNYLVQGFTSEIVNRVMINLSGKLHEVRGRLMVTVHDSIVFEMPRVLLPTLSAFLEDHVRGFIKDTFTMLLVELPYDVDVGPTYGEAKHSIESYTQNTT